MPSSLVAGPPPQRLLRQVWRSPLGLDAARAALGPMARARGQVFAVGWAGAGAELALVEEGTETRVDATLGCSLGFAIVEWVVCSYAVFFFGMTLAARMGEPFAPELLVLLILPLAVIAVTHALALGAQRRLRRSVEQLLTRDLKASQV